MTVEAQLADGTTLQFPDGTDPAVIQAAVQRMIAEQAPKTPPVITGEEVVPTQFGQPTPTGGAQGVDVRGGLEAAATIGSAAIAEPVAGVAGIAQSINPLAEQGAGASAVEATREALTFQPRTTGGQESLQAVAEAVEPVGEAFSAAEQFLGDKTFEITGSPTLAAAATSIPTAITEVLGFASAKAVGKASRSAREASITREIVDAAPSSNELKSVARGVFNEIDDLGIMVKPEAYRSLVIDIKKATKDRGLNKKITPKAAAALREFEKAMQGDVSLTDLDQLRTIAQNAANSIEAPEKMLGSIMIDSIDNFLDRAGPNALNGADEAVGAIADRYKTARDLWGRARRSELLGEAVETARNQASGFENGIRTQFRRILNNKKQRKFFKPNELAEIRQVVEGSNAANLAKLLGRFGFSEGSATNVIGGALGATAGGIVGGVPGAVIVPVLGQISRSFAQRLTEGSAKFADQVIRAGKDARKITRAYLDNTPIDLRDSSELAELLMRTDIDLTDIGAGQLAADAARLAAENRASLGAAAVSGSLGAPQAQQQ